MLSPRTCTKLIELVSEPLAEAYRMKLSPVRVFVDAMTLNHRVPGSSPGAPTKKFQSKAKEIRAVPDK